MAVIWYDKQGFPMDNLNFDEIESRLRDRDYKRVSKTKVGNITISTVWLGLDHNFSGDGPPLIFETMVFHGDMPTDIPGDTWGRGIEQERYSTLEQAEAGHARWVKKYKQ